MPAASQLTLPLVDDRIEWPDFDGDGDADFTLANDSTIRFAIPEGVGQNRATSRYGIDLEQTYYVRATTVGDSAAVDDALANLNMLARGVHSAETDDDISIAA